MTLDKTFYNILFKKEVVAAPPPTHISFLFTFLEEAFLRNIILLCNDNNAVINKSYGRLKGIIWLFKIPMGTSEGFSEIYRRFGQKGSPTEAVVGIHITVWLGYYVD